jgi:hypothetical protein
MVWNPTGLPLAVAVTRRRFDPSCSPSATFDPSEDRAQFALQGGVDFAAIRTKAQRNLLNQRPDRFRRLIAILGGVERFRQPLDLLPIDAGHVWSFGDGGMAALRANTRQFCHPLLDRAAGLVCLF